MDKSKKIILAVISIFGGIWISWYLYNLSCYVSTDNARVKIANIQVVAEVSGYVTVIYHTEGDQVCSTDTILEIDKQKYDFEHERAVAGFEYFKNEYERKVKLVANNFISTEDLHKAKHDFEISRVDLAKANYNLDKSNVAAKANGILTNFDIKVGDFITEGRSLFNIIDKSDIWVEANFKETDIEHIQRGQRAEVTVDTFPGKKWYAKVETIAPAIGAEFSLLPPQNFSSNWIKVTQRIAVRLEFTGNQDLLRLASGMSAEVKIKIR
jgi:membrane fusion protein (multidrug efflux system)